MTFPYYKQLEEMDCGPTCLRMVAKHFGKHYTAQTLREKSQISREGVSMLGIAEAAEVIGFKTVGVKVTLTKLIEEAPLPCVLHWGQNHFVVLYCIDMPKTAMDGAFMSKIWGGRKPQVDINDHTVTSSNREHSPSKKWENDMQSGVMGSSSSPSKRRFEILPFHWTADE